MGFNRCSTYAEELMLAVIETHPIQYHAPVYRVLQTHFDIPVTVIYSSDFSVTGYQDREFGATFAWDADLLSGYSSVFLSRVSQGGARSVEKVSTKGLNKILHKVSPEAVLVVGYSPRFHQIAFYQTWMAGYPILFRGETTDNTRNRNYFSMWGRDHLLQWFYRRCAKLLYVGQHSYAHFKRLGCPDEKLIFSPYCVDTTPFQCDEKARTCFRPTIRQSLGVSENQTVIVFAGKLSPRKGPDLLLLAIKKMPGEIRERIVVWFLGSGQMAAALKDLAESPPTVKVHFLGFQNQTQLSPYYHGADMLILPSLHLEPWGLVVNEALHHGLPCVVSEAVGCSPDLIEPGVTGEVFETGSVQSLVLVFHRALAHTGRPEIRERCRKKVSDYTVEKAAEGIAKAYRFVVEQEAGSYARRV